MSALFKVKETEVVTYEPSIEDVENINKIEDFLKSENIEYKKDDEIFGVYHLGDNVQVRYVNSSKHKMDMSKRNGFDETHKGIQKNYFVNISQSNVNNNIRTIWVFDFEMSQKNDIVSNGEIIAKDYHRQWEVIKNIIKTATGNIKYRIYARDTEVVLVDNKELRPFLETNCFYGYRSASVNLGLRLKKDKYHMKKGDLLMVFTFGYNFYGNKKRQDDPFIEIIRVSTLIDTQVIGGMSKIMKHFCLNYPTIKIANREVKVNELRFYVDASHNDGRGMGLLNTSDWETEKSGLSFNFISWEGAGFMNMYTEDYNGELDSETLELFPRVKALKGSRNEIFHRKPMYHKEIMYLMKKHKIISIENAGTIVYSITRDEFLNRFNDTK